MTQHFIPGRRGLVAVRAEGQPADIKQAIEAVNRGFETFKAEHTKQLDDLRKGKADVVLDEKVERINASVGEMQAKVGEFQVNAQKAIDEVNAKLATASLGGPAGEPDQFADPEYTKAFAMFFREGDNESQIKAKQKEGPRAAMTVGSNPDGGYLAPVEWDRTITGRLKEISPIRQNAAVQSISGPGFRKLYSDRSVGSGWVGETASRPATSTPQVTPLDFNVGELYAFPFASQQLLEDSEVNIEEWLKGEVETEFSRQENIAFLSGDGANKPFGLLTYVTGAANAAKHPWGAIGVVNSGAAAAFTAEGFISLFYDVPTSFRAGAKLYTNRLSQAAMRKLKDGQGNFIWQPSYAAGQPATIAGEAIVEVPDMPSVAAGNIAALYGNMAATYTVVDRIGITVLRDALTNKPFVGFYTRKRVGGGVHNPEPMRAMKIGA